MERLLPLFLKKKILETLNKYYNVFFIFPDMKKHVIVFHPQVKMI